jgi:hypothetical protein
MYLSLMRDTEQAIRVLAEGQKKCEEMFLRDEGLTLDAPPKEKEPAVHDEAKEEAKDS